MTLFNFELPHRSFSSALADECNRLNGKGASAIPAIGGNSVEQSTVETLAQRFRVPWVRAAQLPELFCSWDLAYRCTRGGWLKPVVQGKRRTIYRLADILKCLQRIEAGERPPVRPKRSAR